MIENVVFVNVVISFAIVIITPTLNKIQLLSII
jgi:hypothetical protein